MMATYIPYPNLNEEKKKMDPELKLMQRAWEQKRRLRLIEELSKDQPARFHNHLAKSFKEMDQFILETSSLNKDEITKQFEKVKQSLNELRESYTEESGGQEDPSLKEPDTIPNLIQFIQEDLEFELERYQEEKNKARIDRNRSFPAE